MFVLWAGGLALQINLLSLSVIHKIKSRDFILKKSNDFIPKIIIYNLMIPGLGKKRGHTTALINFSGFISSEPGFPASDLQLPHTN